MHFYSRLSATLLVAVASVSAAVIPRHTYPPPATAREVLHLEPSSWLENIAVRSDGSLLATRLDVPSVYLVDPVNGNYTVVAEFANVTGVFGITEYAPDVFAVAVGNFSTQTFVTVQGSYSVQTLDFNDRTDYWSTITPELLAEVPDAHNLNGLTFRAPSTLYASDSFGFQIYSIDTETRIASVTVPQGPLLSPTNTNSTIPTGVNGLKWDENRNELFFTNSNQITAGRIPADGSGLGAPVQIAAGGYINATDFDDFAIDANGNLLITTGFTNSVVFVSSDFKLESTIAENKDSTTIPLGPTASAYGRGECDSKVLYIATNGDEQSGAQIVAYQFA